MAATLLSIPLDMHDAISQRAQCTIFGTIWNINWDSTQWRVTLFNAEGEAFIVDCSDTPIDPEHITLHQVIQAIGYDMREHHFELISCEEEEPHIGNLYDTSIVSLPLLQFNILER